MNKETPFAAFWFSDCDALLGIQLLRVLTNIRARVEIITALRIDLHGLTKVSQCRKKYAEELVSELVVNL